MDTLTCRKVNGAAYGRADDGMDGGVVSWAAHYIPRGTPIRYLLEIDDAHGRDNGGDGTSADETTVRLVFGTADQVEVELPLSVVASVITVLRAAEREAAAHAYGPTGGDAA